ncbi:hypothetical protein MKW98_005577 [Papaver atlanticum]|uniref:Uncharacterized protein n=1 Tax=Papaver atlanticum TaxID=357466 RepID=A0AAD4ST73_9MAGN|nr:hypothetical protein MKW98_005577 [Papaver atlanticum]
MEALEPLNIDFKPFESHRIELTDDTLSSPDTEEGRRFESMLKRLLEAIRKENATSGDQENSRNDEDGGRAAANGGEDEVLDMFSELMDYLYHSAKFWDVIIPDELATLAAVQEFLTVRNPTTIEEVLRPVILAIIEQEDLAANNPF